jgi:iron complex outermembrane receptor protein
MSTTTKAGLGAVSKLGIPKCGKTSKATLTMGVSLVALMAAGTAFAQESEQPGAGGDGGLQEVVVTVTGSRTVINGNNQPTPVTVVRADELLQTSPTTLTQALEKLPIFGGSTGPASGNFTLQNNLNLRNFGAIRTLILQDGRRVPATTSDGNVDVSTMPELFVQRIDVVTGGASAVYGSDGVTGVVNYVLDHNFNGIKVEAQGGISPVHGDDGSYKLGLAAGTSFFDGRFHIEASYEHYETAGIPNKLDRPIGAPIYCATGLGNAQYPYQITANCHFSGTSFGGLITSGPGKGMSFDQNGILTPFIHGTPVGSPFNNAEIGGDGSYSTIASLIPSASFDQAFLRGDLQVSDNTHGFLQVSLHDSVAQVGQQYVGASSNLTYNTSNPFLSPAVAAALGAPDTTFTMIKSWADSGDIGAKDLIHNISVITGFDGKIGKKWDWNVYYTHAESSTKNYILNNLNNDKWAASLDAVINPANGQLACAVSLTQYANLYPGCVPVNPFGPSSAGSAGLTYAEVNSWTKLDNFMNDVGGTLSGDLFNLPAGGVKSAFTGEFRNLRLDQTTPYLSTAQSSCLGLRYNCTGPNGASLALWFIGASSPVSASESISEGAFEMTAPLLKDMSFAKTLDINAAMRYAHYSVSGNAFTWKTGLDWRPVDALLFRATRSQDIRAPNLYELYAPVVQGLTNFNDSHTNGNYPGSVTLSQGNADLTPEKAQTWTAGFVYTPSWAPRLSVAMDYWNINMTNAITLINGTNILYDQICDASGGTSPYCALYKRPLPFSNTTPANAPTAVLSENLNVAQSWAHGVDLETNYSFDVADVIDRLGGQVSLRGLVSWEPVDKSITAPGQPTINAAGYANGVPVWAGTFFVDYRKGPWAINLDERFRSSVGQNDNTQFIYAQPTVKATRYTDLATSYTFEVFGHSSLSAFFSIQNLFNLQPPVTANGTPASISNLITPYVTGDDLVGRYFTAGIKLRM